MNKNCLVLAFEDIGDLPDNWQGFSQIDAYGQISDSLPKELPENIKVFDKLFQIKEFVKPKAPYFMAFIKHPDPWGETRNWLQAFAAFGECLKGELVCELWFPSEIIALDFLLKKVLGRQNVKFVKAKKLTNPKGWDNYQASWSINDVELQSNMLETYKKEKTKILQGFYKEIGSYFDDAVDLGKALETLNI